MGPTGLMIPISITLIAHAAIFGIWIARQKVNDDAIRALWQQMFGLWARNPELHGLITSGDPIDPAALAAMTPEMRADVATALQLCDGLGGLAGRWGSDRRTLFSLWPVRQMWNSLHGVVEDRRTRMPTAYHQFEGAVALYDKYINVKAAELRGESNVVIVTIAVGIAVLIYALDQTIVASALPIISADLQGITLYGWVFAAYTIAATATTLLYGRLGDLTNRRRLFIIAMSGFLAGSILCGLAPNMPLLIAFRGMQGLFGGATFPLAIRIIADTYPIERRAQGFVIVPTTYALASVLGPLVGGFIAQNIGWRMIFFINVPIVITAITLLMSSYRAPLTHGRLRWQDLDPPGVVALFGGLVTLLLALTTGGNDWDWNSWQEYLMGVGGAGLLAAFVWIELHSSKPLLPLRVLKHRGLGGALVTVALVFWITTTMIVFMPEFSQVGLMTDAQGAGLVLIPLMLTWSITGNISVRIGQRVGFRNVALWGVLPLIAGLVYLYFMRFGFQGWTVAPGLALVGVGAGLINPNMLILAQNSVSDRDQALAGGLCNVAMSLTAAVCASTMTALELNRVEGAAHLSSITNVSAMLTAPGREWWKMMFYSDSAKWGGMMQRWMAGSIHDLFVVAFIPAILLGVWLIFVVLPTNARARAARLGPLRPQAQDTQH
jgi:EmrB/QacA subfamily drug resistance transporter